MNDIISYLESLKLENLTKKFEIWPNSNMEKKDKVYSIIRLIVILTLLGYLITKTLKIVITGFITIVALLVLQKTTEINSEESFVNLKTESKIHEPTQNNPFMNIMIHDIHDNPSRLPAGPSYEPEMEEKINNMAKLNSSDPDKLFNNLGDNLNFEQSMRQFHPTANTQIPNDQTAFAEFCFGK